MANIAAILKIEITRLARKEVRKEVQPLRKLAAGYRREIAELKRVMSSLERRTKALAKSAPKQTSSVLNGEKPLRFVAKGLVSLRKRLGLSAAELGRLLGVSMQSVYLWEHKKTTPRKTQIEAIAALRSVGKKEAHQRLEATAPTPARKVMKRKRSRK